MKSCRGHIKNHIKSYENNIESYKNHIKSDDSRSTAPMDVMLGVLRPGLELYQGHSCSHTKIHIQVTPYRDFPYFLFGLLIIDYESQYKK